MCDRFPPNFQSSLAREQEAWILAIREQPHPRVGGFLSAGLGYDSALSGCNSLQLLVSHGGHIYTTNW